MARDIAMIKQVNLWGKTADNGLGLEPQRSDLFVLDFTTAQKGVAAAANVQLAEILPQFVRSVTPPELKTRAEPVRRDSIPYQMPSWDEPLDPVKVTFVLDTRNEDDKSNVIQFLDAWLALSRAGRGDRFQGFYNTGWLTLDMDYSVNYAYNISLFLLRGAAFSDNISSGSSDAELNTYLANANTAARNARLRQGLVQTGDNIPPTDPAAVQARALSAQNPQGDATTLSQSLIVHSVYLLYNAWLGGYKISDLSYTESNLVTVDATFYIEAFSLEKRPLINGPALLPAFGSSVLPPSDTAIV